MPYSKDFLEPHLRVRDLIFSQCLPAYVMHTILKRFLACHQITIHWTEGRDERTYLSREIILILYQESDDETLLNKKDWCR